LGMASEWLTLPLQKAGIKLIDCDHRTPPAASSGYPYVAIPQMQGGHIRLSGVRRISPDHFREWTRKANPKAYDVVLSRRCNPGETAHVSGEFEFALGQNLVLLRADGSKVHPPFLRWLVKGVEWWDEIGKFLNVGAVFDSLRCADVPNFTLTIPPKEDQQSIATFLGSLDDKIELNRKMNETLEAMARTLFKSWFVDFEPVRAKAEGRPTGLPDSIAALFPDSFEDSEFGEIPAGWSVIPFSESVEIIGGGTPKTAISEYWNGSIPWFSVVDAPSESEIWVIDTDKKITEKGLASSSTTILEIGTTIISARGTVGRVCLVGRPMAMNQSCYGLKSMHGAKGYYTYFATKHLVDRLKQFAHGAVFDTITRDTLASVSIAKPRSEVLAAFENAIDAMMLRVRNGVFESRSLAATRDVLLPKLISGEIRLKSSGTELTE